MKRYKAVDDYVASRQLWQDEIKRLREILLSTNLTEEVKWGGPCYTYDGKNVVGLAGFKSCFGLWFHQGALLKDKKRVLINAQEGTTKALRQWRMRSAKGCTTNTARIFHDRDVCFRPKADVNHASRIGRCY